MIEKEVCDEQQYLPCPKPENHIGPFAVRSQRQQALEFYQQALGANVLSRIEDEKGDVVARLSVNGAEFWLADESPAHANFSPESLNGSSVRLVLTTDDPDAIFEQAIAAGATVVYPVEDQSYGWRVGRFVDPFGHHWEVARPLYK